MCSNYTTSHDGSRRLTRSEMMARVRSRGTQPEAAVEAVLRDAGYRFQTQVAKLPGTPDFVLTRYKLAIFVNGCFWHKHSCRRGQSTPVSNAKFWQIKRSANVLRDQRTTRKLRRAGWSVMTIWECQIKDPSKLKSRLARLIAARTRPARHD